MVPPGDEIPTLCVDGDDRDFVDLVEALLGAEATSTGTRVRVTSVDEAISSLRSGDVSWLVTDAAHPPGDPVRSGDGDVRSPSIAVPDPELTPTHAPLTDVVLDTSTTLMSAEPDEIDTKLRWTLENVGEVLGADRAYVLQFDAEREVMERTHEWTADGVDSGIEVLSAQIGDEYEWLIAQLERFQNVSIERVDELPADASSVREALSAYDVRSFIAIPIVVDWTLLGAVGFDAVRTGSDWRRDDAHTLRTVGDMVAHTLRRQRRERELERKNRQLEEFASVVSHDLRNPLNVASGFLSVTRETDDLSYLTRVERSIDRMEAIIENVLTLAQQGELVGEVDDVDLRETVDDSWRIVDTNGATLDIVDELGAVTADRNRLSAVFENLFSNAVEHGSTSNPAASSDERDDASVTVRIGRLPDEAGFYVEDDGLGIPAERRERVFEHGHSSVDGGTGFGLAIVKQIVEAHGWSIHVEESTTGGARFEIVAPIRVGISGSKEPIDTSSD